MDEETLKRVRELLAAQAQILDHWAAADVRRRRSLWRDLHYRADRVRDAIGEPH